jgi:hypothetical protein
MKLRPLASYVSFWTVIPLQVAHVIVIYEMSVRSRSALFEARATKERVLHLRECAEYVFSHRSSYNSFSKEYYVV